MGRDRGGGDGRKLAAIRSENSATVSRGQMERGHTEFRPTSAIRSSSSNHYGAGRTRSGGGNDTLESEVYSWYNGVAKERRDNAIYLKFKRSEFRFSEAEHKTADPIAHSARGEERQLYMHAGFHQMVLSDQSSQAKQKMARVSGYEREINALHGTANGLDFEHVLRPEIDKRVDQTIQSTGDQRIRICGRCGRDRRFIPNLHGSHAQDSDGAGAIRGGSKSEKMFIDPEPGLGGIGFSYQYGGTFGKVDGKEEKEDIQQSDASLTIEAGDNEDINVILGNDDFGEAGMVESGIADCSDSTSHARIRNTDMEGWTYVDRQGRVDLDITYSDTDAARSKKSNDLAKRESDQWRRLPTNLFRRIAIGNGSSEWCSDHDRKVLECRIEPFQSERTGDSVSSTAFAKVIGEKPRLEGGTHSIGSRQCHSKTIRVQGLRYLSSFNGDGGSVEEIHTREQIDDVETGLGAVGEDDSRCGESGGGQGGLVCKAGGVFAIGKDNAVHSRFIRGFQQPSAPKVLLTISREDGVGRRLSRIKLGRVMSKRRDLMGCPTYQSVGSSGRALLEPVSILERNVDHSCMASVSSHPSHTSVRDRGNSSGSSLFSISRRSVGRLDANSQDNVRLPISCFSPLAEVRGTEIAALAKGTVVDYARKIRLFLEFCAEHKLDWESDESVLDFLYARRGQRALAGFVSAINRYRSLNDREHVSSFQVAEILREARRIGVKRPESDPFYNVYVAKALSRTHITSEKEVRIVVFVITCVALLARPSEVANLNWSDVIVSSDYVQIRLKESKADHLTKEQPRRIFIRRPGKIHCLVKWWIRWYGLSERHEGSVFGKIPSPSKFAQNCFYQIMDWANLPRGFMTGKACRRGGASILLQWGHSPAQIKAMGRWKSDAWQMYLTQDAVLGSGAQERVLYGAPKMVVVESELRR